VEVELYEKVRAECPDASMLLVLRTLERIPDKDEAISIIRNRPTLSPICWNSHYSKWISIDALSISAPSHNGDDGKHKPE